MRSVADVAQALVLAHGGRTATGGKSREPLPDGRGSVSASWETKRLQSRDREGAVAHRFCFRNLSSACATLARII
jgi:hypothetical protein